MLPAGAIVGGSGIFLPLDQRVLTRRGGADGKSNHDAALFICAFPAGERWRGMIATGRHWPELGAEAEPRFNTLVVLDPFQRNLASSLKSGYTGPTNLSN